MACNKKSKATTNSFNTFTSHPLYLYLLIIYSFIPRPLLANEYSHHYEPDDHVQLWANTVGPYHNRQETYEYFSLPFCTGKYEKDVTHRHHDNIGDALQGVELTNSGLELLFKKDRPSEIYCEVELTKDVMKQFIYAIDNHYWFQMYMDDLPIWGIVGEVKAHDSGDVNLSEYYLWTHKKFDIGYSSDQIVDITLTSEKKIRLIEGSSLKFSYEVTWKESTTKFSERYEKYLDHQFFQHRIHWFSIFNSFMMVIFLVGLVSMILMRTLRKDYQRYAKDGDLDEMERDLGDEYGWKQVHGDVFRPAAHRQIFAACIGSGVHMTITVLATILMIIVFELYTEHGSIVSYAIFSYAILSPINGFVSSGLYARMGGVQWIRQMLMSTFLVPGMIATTVFLVNIIAIYYHASRAIPFTTMMAITAICVFIILPLNLIGALFGRNSSGQSNVPCRVNAVPRPIPDAKCIMKPSSIVLLGGVLPFGSIFIEMYFIFTSFWAYKVYYVYGFTLLVLLILLIVTVCVAIVCTYFLLNSEDYRWRWTSFATAGSTALYTYCYSIYYFMFKTKMYGLFQTVFYFSYMALFALTLGLMCGAIGYCGTSLFVHKIYTIVKID